MKINLDDIVNVLIALLVFEVVNRLFLSSALDSLEDTVTGQGNYDAEEDEF